MGFSSTYLQFALVVCLAVGLFAPAGGAFTLLLQDEPDLTPDQVKYRLWLLAGSDPLHWTALRRNAVSWTQRAGARSGGKA